MTVDLRSAIFYLGYQEALAARFYEKSETCITIRETKEIASIRASFGGAQEGLGVRHEGGGGGGGTKKKASLRSRDSSSAMVPQNPLEHPKSDCCAGYERKAYDT